MNYIYDIYLNFNKVIYDFFDWNKNDKIIHLKMIPVFKTNEEDLKNFITHNIQIEEKYFKYIYKTAKIWNNKRKNYALFCDDNTVIALEFNDYGKSVNKSFLFINEELDVLENTYKQKSIKLEYKILSKTTFLTKTRKQINEEKYIKQEVKNMDNEKLKYIYFECFNKYEENRNIIINKILNLSKNSKVYKNLYNILKLTS